MSKLGDYVSIKASKKKLSGEKFWLLNLDVVEQQTGTVLEYNYVSSEDLNGSIIQFDTNCVLYSKLRPNLNKVVLPQMDGFATSEMLPLRPATSVLSREYLTEFLRSENFVNWAVSKTAGAKMPRLGTKELLSKEISVPSMAAQKHIVSLFEEVAHLIVLRKQQIIELDKLVKSRFIELFGDPVVNPKSWETAPLSALIINANNGMARRGKDADGSIVLRLVELQNGFIDYSAPNRICLNETEKKRYELVDNDFLFARVNGNPDYVGRCAVFKSIDEPVFHNDHIIRVHFDEAKINGCFMSVLLNSDYGKRQMREQIKTSAGQYTISQDGIGAIIAILPPLELQNQFAAFVEQTDKSKLAIQQSITELEKLKKSLMQKYFG